MSLEYNPDGQIADMVYLETNAAFEQLTGFSDVVGKRVSAFYPNLEAVFFDILKEVAQTGGPIRIEEYVSDTQRWYDVVYSRIGDAGSPFIVGVFRDVTQRKNTEKALRVSEEKFRTLFNLIDEGFVIIEMIRDDAGKWIDFLYLEANAASEKHVGKKPEDLIGKTALEMYPDLDPSWAGTFGGLVDEGKTMRFENYVKEDDIWYEVSAYPMSGDQIAVIYYNINERKKQEQRQAYLLQLSDALRTLADPLLIQQTAMEIIGRHLAVNRAFYGELLEDNDTLVIGKGYAEGTFPLEGIVRFSEFDVEFVKEYQAGRVVIIADTHSDDRISDKAKAEFDAISLRAAMGASLVKDEKVVAILSLHQTEPRKWTETEILLLKETAERTWAAVERAKSEQQLAQLNQSLERQVAERTAELVQGKEFLRAIIDNSPDMIQVFKAIRDESGKIIDFRWTLNNKTSNDLYGNIGGRTLLENNPGVIETGIFDAFVQVTETGIPQRYEKHYTLEQFDGWFYQSVVKFDDGVATSTTEITARKMAELQILSLNQELNKKNRELEALNLELKTFTDIAANDYRVTLHNTYMNFEQMLKQDATKLTDSTKASIRRAQSGIQKLKLLTEDMVSFLRLSVPEQEIEWVDLNQVAEAVLSDLQPKIAEKNATVGKLELPYVKGFPVLLSLLLRNLLDNALKFSKEGMPPQIEISSHKEIVQAKGIMVPSAFYKISIADNGIGFENEKAEDLFQIFYRHHQPYKGPGVGLAICRKIMALHGGFIRAEGNPGAGSVFCCFFPARLM